jgi:hypothetical protein
MQILEYIYDAHSTRSPYLKDILKLIFPVAVHYFTEMNSSPRL